MSLELKIKLLKQIYPKGKKMTTKKTQKNLTSIFKLVFKLKLEKKLVKTNKIKEIQ